MSRWVVCGLWSLAISAGLAASRAALGEPAPEPSSAIAPLDLAQPFHTRSPWRLVATQGPPVVDYGDNPAPGALRLCLEKVPGGPCVSDSLSPPSSADAGQTIAWEPHYLVVAKPVYPRGAAAAPLLMVVTASMFSGDGDQLMVTHLLKYSPASDHFEQVYFHSTGHNNNQDTRFVAKGLLRGDVISVEPAENRPYGYWVVVDSPTSTGTYREALRYRSATLYGDGNPLSVIDSEMPNILERLGLWKPGSPLPLPEGKPCPRPHLKHTALWCE